MKKERYVIIDTRTTCGNSVFFWCWDSVGYTVDLRCAGIFEEGAAKKICAGRDTDKMVRYSDAVKLVQHHVDIQDLRDIIADRQDNYTPRQTTHVFSHLRVDQ